jgi:hypothetical protein
MAVATRRSTSRNGSATKSRKQKKVPARPTSALETILPRDAKAMLKRNKGNRNVRENKVQEFAGDMKRGAWIVNGESIQFDIEGRILNGQHRLLACVMADTAFTTFVVRNLPKEAQTTMDTGIKRNLGDTLRWRGEKDVYSLGGALRIIWYFKQTRTITTQGIRVQPTKSELLTLLDEHPEIRDYIAPPRADENKKLLAPSVSAALYYLFSRVDEDDAKEFFKRLGSGANLSENDPIFRLRNVLIQNRGRTHSKMSTKHKAALAVKAFNAWREGREITLLRYASGGAKPEPFPMIDGYPYE